MSDGQKVTWKACIQYRTDSGSDMMHIICGAISDIEGAIEGRLPPGAIVMIWVSPIIKPGEEVFIVPGP
jgi:hypothetical protein